MTAAMSAPARRVITVFGGGGFIGRELLRRLARSPAAGQLHVRVASRAPAPSSRLAKLAPGLGGLTAVQCDITDGAQVAAAVRGATHVVNCVGILYETPSRGVTFRAMQQEGPAVISDTVSAEVGESVERVVHVSAIGADKDSASKYASTKALGEREFLRLGEERRANVTVLRPSIVFGPEDSFFNRFADLAKYLPFLPLVGGGTTKFQPVHVADVAEAINKALCVDEEGNKDLASGAVYELGGKTVLTFKEIMEMVLKASGRRRLLLPIPFPVANMQGTLYEVIHKFVPSVPPLLTRDQVQLLKKDNVVSAGAKTLSDLGIQPRACNLDEISYLR